MINFINFFTYIYTLFQDIFSIIGFSELKFYYDLELNCSNNNPSIDYALYVCQGSVSDYLALICCLIVVVLLLIFIIKLFKMIFNRFSGF